MSNAVSLSDVSTDDLVSELLRRPGIVASVWNKEDVTPIIDDDENCNDLTEEQAEQAALAFLSNVRKGLEDALASRGNDYLSDRWEMDKEGILAEVAPSSTPTCG